ncbi:MAG: response regulator transcription factor [Anaerolineaceae bacterium]
MKTIRVLIVDDHSIFRKGIRAALEGHSGFEVIGETGNGLDAIQMAVDLMPDIILMDIAMPGCSGLEATRQIKCLVPNIHIVILTVSDMDEDLFEAIKSGAQGYVQKDVSANELGQMLPRVINGEALLSGVLAAKIMKEFIKEKSDAKSLEADPLTPREIEVMTLVVDGYSNHEIAKRLVITENTVKHHLSNILEKLHMNNRIQLAIYSLEHGLIKK